MNEQIEILERAGLNWNVRSEGLKTTSGIVVPKKIALVREDTETVLGTHGDGYDPYQNHELLELLHKIGNSTGLNFHSCGQFKGGQRVWFQLKSDDHNLNGDKIKGFISGFNSFDGSSSLAFGNSSLTVSCMNTWWRAYKEVNTRIRHSGSMRPKIEEILKKIDIVLEEEKKMFEEIVMLNDVQMDEAAKELVIKKLFSLDMEERLDISELSTRKKNQIEKFNYDLGIETSQKGDNLWGLFSGITRYTTHSMKNGDNSEAKMFCRTGNLERKIFNELVELV